ncbi:Mu transposase C-terminal domain-containing protein [Aquitalea sp.]|uniref:Mu transposase C-terminal domain-containing protein n=1 Tax=Aquitalea sp. TaxID=1872623 RepID=UPI0025852433|nr:Mu transposase C-terminal domain-containing protein [Aquitalea sp.]
MVIDQLQSGTIIKTGGRTLCVRRMLSRQQIEAVDIQSNETCQLSLKDLTDVIRVSQLQPRTDLAILDEEDWSQAMHHYKVIAPLLARERCTKADVSAAGQAAGISPATLYRWISRFNQTGTISSLVRKERSDQGQTRTTGQAEAIMKTVIRDVFLTEQALTPTQAYRKVTTACRKAGVTTPHLSTFRRRLKELTPATLAAAREGKQSARKFRSIKGRFPGADYPYAVLQIDHTLVDIILVDDAHRLPIRRPYITVAIDVFSRMVAGYYISFDPPGTLGTGLCIANAVLGKQAFLDHYGLSYAWPCQGLPRVIHVDNAKEFRGNTLKMACNEYEIDLQFRPVRQPNYGGHIERLMGTLMAEIHALPGTTRSHVAELREYKPEQNAAMTLSEFEKWFANMVLGAYHHRIHSELGMPPVTRFEEGLYGNGQQPGTGLPPLPSDAEQLRIDFLPHELRSVQPYGVSWDGIYYQADVLSRWIGSSDPKKTREARKFIIRRDPRDISYVLFFDPEAKRYFRIPYQNPRFPSISLWELRAIKRYLKDQGKKAEDQDVIFTAFDEMQRIEEEARSQTKSSRIAQAKRTARQKALAKTTSHSEEAALTPVLPSLDIGQIKPYDDVEEF